jgi:hypothetical protein
MASNIYNAWSNNNGRKEKIDVAFVNEMLCYIWLMSVQIYQKADVSFDDEMLYVSKYILRYTFM